MNEVEQTAGGKALPDPAMPIRRDRPAWAGWLLAAALAVAWHGFWGVWLQAGPAPAPARPPAVPDVSYLPAPAASTTADPDSAGVRWLGSPVLFSLPTPVGFSRSALTNEIGSRPPLALPGDATVFLERRAPVRNRVIRMSENIEALMRPSPARVPLRLPDVPAPAAPPAATGETIRVEFFGGLLDRRLAHAELPDDPRVRGDAAWEAGAYLEVDADGRVRHVLLESPSASPKLNGMLVRVLRGWRLEPPGEPRSGRVVLRYPGRARPAEPPGTLGAP